MAPTSLGRLRELLGLARPGRPEPMGQPPRTPSPDLAGRAAQAAARSFDERPFSPAGLRVHFTPRAWTSVLSETLTEVRTETGGILLGRRRGNDWVVVESIDPGPNSVFQMAYFEYDQPYVTHLANRIARLYEEPLEVIGLWHRHPGSFDRFSGTDDGTNASYAQLSPLGALSGLINIDPDPRLTLFHVSAPLTYARVPFDVLSEQESLAAAPLRDPESLELALRWDNARAQQGMAPAAAARVSAPRAVLNLDALATCWDALLCAEAVEADAPADDSLVTLLQLWSDDELALAQERLEADADFLARHDAALVLRADDRGRLAVVAAQGDARLTLGTLAVDRTSPGSLVLLAPQTGAALTFAPGLVERAVRGR